MKRVLIFVDWFLPGYKAGGQLQSCANLAFAIQNTVEVYLVTSDRDLGDTLPYPSITTDKWILLDKIKVYYVSPANLKYGTIRTLIADIQPHCIYLNSMFSIHFTIMAIAACAYDKNIPAKVVLAPRGMLHKGALQYKKIKKQFFLKSFRLLRLHHKIVFHATDQTEKADIKKSFGSKAVIKFINDYPASLQYPLQHFSKEPGVLKCIFVSRISPKKNLLFLLQTLLHVKAAITLTIIGPVEEEGYWLQCKQLIEKLPGNILVHYAGAVANNVLHDFYAQHHLFTLFTHGENFGHVIFESLLAGRPVLISDQTPWQKLQEKGIGWDLPLSAQQQFVNVIEEAAGWDQSGFNRYCKASWNFAQKTIQQNDLKKEYTDLFVGQED